MKKFGIVFLALFLATSSAVSAVRAQSQLNTEKQAEWIASVIKDIQKIKVGMTRGEMRKVFGEEGGISTTRQRKYIYRGCPYIKVDFEFESRGPEIKDVRGVYMRPEFDLDVITKMSKPYLEFSIDD